MRFKDSLLLRCRFFRRKFPGEPSSASILESIKIVEGFKSLNEEEDAGSIKYLPSFIVLSLMQ